VTSALGQTLGRQRAEVLDVVRHYSAVLAARGIEHVPVASPDEVVTIRDGFDVVAVTTEQRGNVRRELLVE